jgi:hypothetical protein
MHFFTYEFRFLEFIGIALLIFLKIFQSFISFE